MCITLKEIVSKTLKVLKEAKRKYTVRVFYINSKESGHESAIQLIVLLLND